MRTSIRTLTLPAAALLAALALTACQSADQEAAPPAPAKPTATTTAAPTTSAPATSAPAPTTEPPATAPTKAPTKVPTKAPTTAPKKTTAPPAKPSLRPCTAADVKVVASKVSRPVNHLALTITNTGDRTCHALNAPLVGFDHSQAPIAIVEDSKPQAVVSLAPGASGYASLILTGEPGEDTHGMTVRTIKVNLTADSMVTLKAPEGTYVDDGAAVSYWQQELADALQY
ncbi:DUF4232 domain-containing protein [Streptomyces sp. R302]|uniref:DUF4232 domain-containing protein n=1 Tax=unclassified Streptomyces TaxID=2593676 RepID=UPI00145D329F|nr:MULTISPECIES: DUF4232 domain-containing protein [unclassified Streptomyces]NML54949.1 DUF4232 domain-containing protein [Streptomyces sp. R301]NML83636.1 DUF4232 domain-containing protein [Streptomyces sp. R302]